MQIYNYVHKVHEQVQRRGKNIHTILQLQSQ